LVTQFKEFLLACQENFKHATFLALSTSVCVQFEPMFALETEVPQFFQGMFFIKSKLLKDKVTWVMSIKC
jgi:hypothetical protein